jgi:hypothetical protein
MAQSGFTPLQMYASSTGGNVPTTGNLTNSASGSELAINIADGKLFYKDNVGVVQVIATKAAAAGIFTSPTITGGTFAGGTFTGGTFVTPTITSILETATVSATAATGTINLDALTQAVLYYTTNASANWTLNVRGSGATTLNSVMAIGQSLSVSFLVTQGATAYYNSAVTIDGVSVTPKWQGGTAPSSGNASSVDVYTYAIIKTASATFTVFASQTKFA